MARQKEQQVSSTPQEMYEYVIADLSQDPGWQPEKIDTTLSVLKQRLHLIVEVHPKLFDETPDLMEEYVPKATVLSWLVSKLTKNK
jgi:hypothetical protein